MTAVLERTAVCEVPGCGKPSDGYARGRLPGETEWHRIGFCRDCASNVPAWALFDYLLCRRNGAGHTLAEMLALQQPPMSNTDREFLQGHCNGSQFADRPDQGDAYAAIAREEGADITGKVYLSSLAAYPGDPRAWVSGRGDAQKVCEERGWDCDGSVTVKAARRDHGPGPAVADDLLEDAVDKMILDSPEPVKESRQELKEKALEKHKPYWAEK